MSAVVIGIDPGPIPGIVRLTVANRRVVAAEALQCTHGLAPTVLAALLSDTPGPSLVAIERYVVSNRSGRSAAAQAGEITRDLVGALQREADVARCRVALRSASEVKPWATDDRLAHAGLLEPTKSMRHARDAARHALFAAVRADLIPDPLSRKSIR